MIMRIPGGMIVRIRIHFAEGERFQAREALTFHERLQKVAFIGDWARKFRGKLNRKLSEGEGHVYLEPLQLLAEELQDADPNATIGGPPQLIRVTRVLSASMRD